MNDPALMVIIVGAVFFALGFITGIVKGSESQHSYIRDLNRLISELMSEHFSRISGGVFKMKVVRSRDLIVTVRKMSRRGKISVDDLTALVEAMEEYAPDPGETPKVVIVPPAKNNDCNSCTLLHPQLRSDAMLADLKLIVDKYQNK